MTFNKHIIVAALAACTCLAAHAQEKNQDGENYVDQLNKLEAQTQILQRQAALRTLRQQAAGTDMVAGMPRVIAAFGLENAMVAKLAMPDGSIRLFRENQWVNNYVRIAAISGGGVLVTIKDKKELVSLPFAASAGAPPPPQSPQTISDAMLPPPPHISMPVPLPPPKLVEQPTAVQSAAPSSK